MTFLERQIVEAHRNINKDEVNSFTDKHLITITEVIDLPHNNKVVVLYKKYSDISYNDLVNGMIRDKYSESEEFAILRKSINGITDEFTTYNTYVEDCKLQAKAWIANRDNV